MKMQSRWNTENNHMSQRESKVPSGDMAHPTMARSLRLRLALVLSLALAVLTLAGQPMRGAAQTTIPDTQSMAGAEPAGTDLPPVADELLVKFAPGTTPEAAAAILAARGMTVKRYVPGIDWYIASLAPRAAKDSSAGASTALAETESMLANAQSSLAQSGSVSVVEPNAQGAAALHPSDPDYNSPNLVYAPQKINAEAAWDVTTGQASLVVAVVDSGVSLTHPEFAGRLVAGYDFVGGDTDPSDAYGHGTHIAGIIAAAINNGQGIVGIAPNVKIMPVRVLNNFGQGNWGNWASGIVYAVDNGAKVINLSLGSTVFSQIGYDAIRYAYDHGIVVVAAAGNNGNAGPFYPASWDETIAVGATDQNDNVWSLSNHGAYVDLSAPGWSIWSTNWSAAAPNGYKSRTGTSAAGAHVSGLAALLLSVNPALTPDQLRSTMQQTAHDLGAVGWDEYYGSGRIDAGAAVTSLLYRQRANSGGASVYTDGAGQAWITDTLYAGSGWGYISGTAKSSTLSVAGTTDDGLYQAWRETPGDYQFTVPNGMYTVTLKFAEFEVTRSTDRVMRISLEGVVVDNALSIYGSAGKAVALDRVYTSVVTDGMLNITLAQNGGIKPPVVSAIDVRQSTP